MSPSRRRLSRLRAAAAVTPAFALVATGLVASVASQPDASPSAAVDEPTDAADGYINYVPPRVETEGTDPKFTAKSKAASGTHSEVSQEGLEVDRKYAQGNPVAARQLANLEQQAIETGKSPREIKQAGAARGRPDSRFKEADGTQTAKLLTILVEFDEEADDDFTDSMVPRTVFEDRTCEPGNVQNGPLHNNIPDPAEAEQEDNNSLWVEDFSSDFYDRMLYTEEGITERVRPDLTGPDGEPGIDMSGSTMRNMYEEMSKGAYTVDGEATPWVTVPHSEGWYGANRCTQDENGEWDAGPEQGMQGHPDNPRGPQQLAIDAVEALAEAEPDFPWEDYDIEDQGDRDGDGDLFEPDGVIDHVVLVHAGADKSGGGGAQGPYAIWAHSSSVAGGADIPGTDLRLSNYIVQPEDSGVGVFAHEYGHDLGLPDLYDTSGQADSDVDFWDLMASGSHSGPIFQSMPTHMGIWDKWVLGWADPLTIEEGDQRRRMVKLGQTSRTPKGTEDGIKIDLPDKEINLADPHSGDNMWWSGNDQDWADIKLSRSVDVPSGTSDARFWMWNDYVIEADWDFGFVEVSTDGGDSWDELQVFDEDGNEVSTPDDYGDPNGRLADYGDKKYGLTGSTEGWRHDWVDLTPYAGETVDVRLRMATDAAFLERGWFADDFSVTSDGEELWSDDVESGEGDWTAEGGTFTDTSGDGWRIDTGTQIESQFYLAEWRNLDSFDEGLQYAYDTSYSRDSWKVERVPYNVPGMLVWYRDTTYGETNHVTADLTGLPSYGSKGGLLIADSHFDPLRREGEAAEKDESELKNLPSRPQSSNAAFSLNPTYPFTECFEAPDEPYSEYCTDFDAQEPVAEFTDSRGWYPGVEVRGDELFYRDVDASVVVPSRDVEPYTTRVVNPDGSPAEEYYGMDIGGTVLGTGNPADDDADFGTTLRVLKSAQNDYWARVRVVPPTL